jgi:outer membrane protein assembly factor BamB
MGRAATLWPTARPPAARCTVWFAALALSCCLTRAAATADGPQPAADWPFIRGAHFDGHSSETGLADAWPSAGPPVLWTRGLGQGYSSFVAWSDRVATQAQTLGGQFVFCLSADTGETIWRYRYGWPYEPAGVYPGPRATPTYADGKLYFAAPDGQVGCLTAESGRLLWSRNPVKEFEGQGVEFGYACSPVVVDGKVIVPVGGRDASLVALNAHDGSVVWHAGDDPASYAPAYPVSVQGRSVVLGYLRNALVCHDLQTGQRIWRHDLSSGYDEHSAWPIYREPYVWISSPFQGGSELLELTGNPQSPARTVWRSDYLSNDIFSSVLVGDALYGFDLREAQAKVHRPSRGTFMCMDFQTGQVRWTFGDPRLRRTMEVDAGQSAPCVGHALVIAADNKLILLNDTGELILARPRTDRYEELARAPVLTGEICWSQPVLRAGRLFLRTHSRAVCLYLGAPANLDPTLRTRLLTLEDIPQQRFVDLTAVLLGVEPDYAFDLPSPEWFCTWYVAGSALLLLSILTALVGCGAVRLSIRRWPRYEAARWLCWSAAFGLGAVGTTWLSLWRNDFVFTWPLALFVAFQAVVAQCRSRRSAAVSRTASWVAVATVAFFVASCLAYYWLCRRLSLVTEWGFLCGFMAALPFSIAAVFLCQRSRWRLLWETFVTLLAFAAFYWSAVAVQVLKR